MSFMSEATDLEVAALMNILTGRNSKYLRYVSEAPGCPMIF